MDNIFKKLLQMEKTHHKVRVILNDGNESFTFKYIDKVDNESEEELTKRVKTTLNEEYEPWGYLQFEIEK